MAPTYFRNTTFLNGIEAGSLWQLTKNHFVLVDDDQHVTAPLSARNLFLPIAIGAATAP
jgi:hypothetical protein